VLLVLLAGTTGAEHLRRVADELLARHGEAVRFSSRKKLLAT
jgi:hypothetical protein